MARMLTPNEVARRAECSFSSARGALVDRLRLLDEARRALDETRSWMDKGELIDLLAE
jgi:hypothetical protein